MSYCAYELDIDTTNLKEELREYSNDQEYDEWGAFRSEGISESHYIDHNTVGKYTKKFYSLFKNGLLTNMRFLRTSHAHEIYPHIDQDLHSPNANNFNGEIPPHSIRTSTINVLLNEDESDDITNFYYDMDLIKYGWKNQDYYNRDKDKGLKLMDSFQLKNKPLLINTGTWHSINYTTRRSLASFMFHPIISYNGCVEYCRENKLLIER